MKKLIILALLLISCREHGSICKINKFLERNLAAEKSVYLIGITCEAPTDYLTIEIEDKAVFDNLKKCYNVGDRFPGVCNKNKLK